MAFILLMKNATADSIQYEVSILNSGNRARKLHWNFLLPRSYQRWLSFSPELVHKVKQTQSTIEDIHHDHYRSYTKHPVYQGRRQYIGLLTIDRRGLDKDGDRALANYLQ